MSTDYTGRTCEFDLPEKYDSSVCGRPATVVIGGRAYCTDHGLTVLERATAKGAD